MEPTTLVIDPGSSSRRYAIFRKNKEVCSAYYETENSGFVLTFKLGDKNTTTPIDQITFDNSLEDYLKHVDDQINIETKDIQNVGIRIVAPGRLFMQSRLIDDGFYQEIVSHKNQAPLHLGTSVDEIQATRMLMPNSDIYAISDSEFHANMTHLARNYAIPRKDAEKADLYRYGYHGLSVSSVVRQITKTLGKTPKTAIVCHLGSGASITALRNGESIDTSMGYSPLEGLVMSTRSGDVNADAAIELADKLKLSKDELIHYLNHESGLKGLSGVSGDIRQLLDLEQSGNADASFALELMVYRIQKYIGSYIAVLGGLDVLVFTATVGERSAQIREKVCESLRHLGIELDTNNNRDDMTFSVISKPSSSVLVCVVPSLETTEINYRIMQLSEATE